VQCLVGVEMAENNKLERKNIKICLLGADFDTGNMGVAALAEASIKVILNRWPNAEVTLLGSSVTAGKDQLKLSGREVKINKLPIRFCWNVFLPCHFVVFFLNAVLLKSLPWNWSKKLFSTINPYVRAILETDVALDITGGDSFSDIYGMRRFALGFLRKWIVLLFNKDLIMLPQTYGPFKRRVARAMARHILNRASLVYSRDWAGIDFVNALLNNSRNGKVRFVPDVAFVLDSREPQNTDIDKLKKFKSRDTIVVGLNVSGLLYNHGHTRNERFGLKTDYRQLVYRLARLLLENDKVKLLLVPHVVSPAPVGVNDSDACLELYKQLGREYPGRIFLVKGEYDQGEIKYVIGLCDFFIGSRMHSCIAALSQYIPAVGIAYSKKFEGVFESIGVEDYIADACQCSEDELLRIVRTSFEKREQTRAHLNKVIPEVKAEILEML